MPNRRTLSISSCALLIAAVFSIAVSTGTAAESGTLLNGKAAMGDWKSDAPGVARKITVADLPPPSSNVLAINRARVVDRPADAQLRVSPGFKIELYASRFRDPRFLLTAPNGDIFVVESRVNQIKVLRDSNGDGKPDVTEIFTERDLNKPFGIAFYPPGNDPQFLYVANTDGVIRFPYRNGDLKALVARRTCAAADIGPGTLYSHLMAKKCMSQSVRAPTFPITPRKPTARASSSSILMGQTAKFMHGEFAMR